MFFASILAICSALAVVCYCWRKQNRLRRELTLTELELNQHGVEGPRQRRRDGQRRDTQGVGLMNRRSGYEALIIPEDRDRKSPTDETPMLN